MFAKKAKTKVSKLLNTDIKLLAKNFDGMIQRSNSARCCTRAEVLIDVVLRLTDADLSPPVSR